MAEKNPAFDVTFYEIHVHGISEKSYRCTLKGKSPDEKENVFFLPAGMNKAGKPFIEGAVSYGICSLGIPRWLRDKHKQLNGVAGQTDWQSPVKREDPGDKLKFPDHNASPPQESLKDILRKAYGMAEDEEVKDLIKQAGQKLP